MSAGVRLAEVATVAALGLPGRPPAVARRRGSGFTMLPEKLVQRWETAYRRYGEASKAAASSVAGDRDAAREMAAASWEVAAAWREMESTADIPWWALAALCAAAQAFEIQARDWNARAAHGWPADDGRRSRPNVQLAARARPKVCREPEREAAELSHAPESAEGSEGRRHLLRGESNAQ